MPDLAQQRVTELMAGTVVHLFEVVAVQHPEAEREPALLRSRESSLELQLEAAPVEQAGQRVGESTPALAPERECCVDRGSGLGGEHRRHLRLLTRHFHRPTARADQDSEVIATCAQGEQDSESGVTPSGERSKIDLLDDRGVNRSRTQRTHVGNGEGSGSIGRHPARGDELE